MFDSESGHHYSENPPLRRVFALWLPHPAQVNPVMRSSHQYNGEQTLPYRKADKTRYSPVL